MNGVCVCVRGSGQPFTCIVLCGLATSSTLNHFSQEGFAAKQCCHLPGKLPITCTWCVYLISSVCKHTVPASHKYQWQVGSISGVNNYVPEGRLLSLCGSSRSFLDAVWLCGRCCAVAEPSPKGPASSGSRLCAPSPVCVRVCVCVCVCVCEYEQGTFKESVQQFVWLHSA